MSKADLEEDLSNLHGPGECGALALADPPGADAGEQLGNHAVAEPETQKNDPFVLALFS